MNQFSNHPLYRSHNIDSALSSLWNFYKRKFVVLFIMSLIMSAVIQYFSSKVNISDLSSTTDPFLLLSKLKSLMLPILTVTLISLLSSTILQYYIIFNPVNSSVNPLRALTGSLRYFVPFLIIMVLFAFAATTAVILGVFLLVIGAFFAMLYAATIYFFILPVMMAEDANIGMTIARTVKLVHKNFWPNLGWVAVFIIIMIVVSLLLSGIILIPFTGSFVKTIFNPGDQAGLVEMADNPLFLALSALMGALTLPFMPIFSCILYFNGRAREEQEQQAKLDNRPDEGKLRVEDLYAKPYSENHPDNLDKIQ